MPVLDEKSSTTGRRSSKREGVVFTVSARSSSCSYNCSEESQSEAILSLSSHNPCDSLHAVTRLRLVLTLTHPSPAADSYPSSCSNYDSTDSLDILTRSPSALIPTLPPPESEHAERRKKMAKLVQLLGGPIPPALVFPPHNPKNRHTRRRSRSVPPVSCREVPPTTAREHIIRPAPFVDSAPPPQPNKLVRPRPEPVLPELTVDCISRPRPLMRVPSNPACAPTAYSSSHSTRPPTSYTNSHPTRSTRTSATLAPRSRSAYNLRRRARESACVGET